MFSHTEVARALRLVTRRHVAFFVVVGGTDDVAAGAIAVVEHVLRLAVAIGIEHLPDMGQAVPLGRVLQGQDDLVVAYDVGGRRVVTAQRIVHVRSVTAHGGLQHRRVAARRQNSPAGIIQWQRQAEGLAGFYLGDALQDLFGRQQIKPATFIIRSPIAPGGTWRAAGPTLVVCHDAFLLRLAETLLRPRPRVKNGRGAAWAVRLLWPRCSSVRRRWIIPSR